MISKLTAVTVFIGILSVSTALSQSDSTYQTVTRLNSTIIKGASKDALRNILTTFDDLDNKLQRAIRISNQERIETIHVTPEKLHPKLVVSNDPSRFFSERTALNIPPNVEEDVHDFEALLKVLFTNFAGESQDYEDECVADMGTLKVTQVLSLMKCGMMQIRTNLGEVVENQGSLLQVVELKQAQYLIGEQGSHLLDGIENLDSKMNQELMQVEKSLNYLSQKLDTVVDRLMREV